jgi:hypothetical protein
MEPVHAPAIELDTVDSDTKHGGRCAVCGFVIILDGDGEVLYLLRLVEHGTAPGRFTFGEIMPLRFEISEP